MKIISGLLLVLWIATAAWALSNWQKLKTITAERDALNGRLVRMEEERTSWAAKERQRTTELDQLRTDVQELPRLRNEVTQLRKSSQEITQLRSANERLQEQQQQLRAAAASAATNNLPTPQTAVAGRFPKEQWNFAGYTSPQNALVSAIWSMREGNPKTYFESLTPEEQVRMSKAWEGKSEAEVAAKHRQDTTPITGLQVLGQQSVTPEETVMNVYIEGVNRVEKVSMKRVGNDWKFGGFIREAGK